MARCLKRSVDSGKSSTLRVGTFLFLKTLHDTTRKKRARVREARIAAILLYTGRFSDGKITSAVRFLFVNVTPADIIGNLELSEERVDLSEF